MELQGLLPHPWEKKWRKAVKLQYSPHLWGLKKRESLYVAFKDRWTPRCKKFIYTIKLSKTKEKPSQPLHIPGLQLGKYMKEAGCSYPHQQAMTQVLHNSGTQQKYLGLVQVLQFCCQNLESYPQWTKPTSILLSSCSQGRSLSITNLTFFIHWKLVLSNS